MMRIEIIRRKGLCRPSEVCYGEWIIRTPYFNNPEKHIST